MLFGRRAVDAPRARDSRRGRVEGPHPGDAPALWRWNGSTTPETRLARKLQRVARDRRLSRGCHVRGYVGRSDAFVSEMGCRDRVGPQPRAVLGRGPRAGPRGPR